MSGMIAGFVNELYRNNAGRLKLTLDMNEDPFDQEI